MKVEIKEQPQQIEREYPYVGECENQRNPFHVLFVAKQTGLSLDHCFWGAKHFSDDWCEEAFTPLPPNSVTITI